MSHVRMFAVLSLLLFACSATTSSGSSALTSVRPQPLSDAQAAPAPQSEPLESSYALVDDGGAPGTMMPRVVTPPGWAFDDRTGVGTKQAADGSPLGICTIRLVPKMNMTVAEHIKILSDAIQAKNSHRVSLRGGIKVSPDGSRAILGVTLRKVAGSPPSAEGFAIIRKVKDVNDGYVMCMSNWDPTKPEIQAEAEKLCDSFSVVKSSPPASPPAVFEL